MRWGYPNGCLQREVTDRLSFEGWGLTECSNFHAWQFSSTEKCGSYHRRPTKNRWQLREGLYFKWGAQKKSSLRSEADLQGARTAMLESDESARVEDDRNVCGNTLRPMATDGKVREDLANKTTNIGDMTQTNFDSSPLNQNRKDVIWLSQNNVKFIYDREEEHLTTAKAPNDQGVLKRKRPAIKEERSRRLTRHQEWQIVEKFSM